MERVVTDMKDMATRGVDHGIEGRIVIGTGIDRGLRETEVGRVETAGREIDSGVVEVAVEAVEVEGMVGKDHLRGVGLHPKRAIKVGRQEVEGMGGIELIMVYLSV